MQLMRRALEENADRQEQLFQFAEMEERIKHSLVQIHHDHDQQMENKKEANKLLYETMRQFAKDLKRNQEQIEIYREQIEIYRARTINLASFLVDLGNKEDQKIGKVDELERSVCEVYEDVVKKNEHLQGQIAKKEKKI